jgi:hypothetical protein
MNKSLFNIVGVAILSIIIIALILTFSGVIPGKLGDYAIMGSSFIISIIVLIYLKKNKN